VSRCHSPQLIPDHLLCLPSRGLEGSRVATHVSVRLAQVIQDHLSCSFHWSSQLSIRGLHALRGIAVFLTPSMVSMVFMPCVVLLSSSTPDMAFSMPGGLPVCPVRSMWRYSVLPGAVFSMCSSPPSCPAQLSMCTADFLYAQRFSILHGMATGICSCRGWWGFLCERLSFAMPCEVLWVRFR